MADDLTGHGGPVDKAMAFPRTALADEPRPPVEVMGEAEAAGHPPP